MKDFYLCGDKAYFHRGTAFFNTQLQSLCKDVIHVLLSTQYIKSPISNGLWKMVSGSGMGLIHSGDLVDFSFWWAVERCFVESLKVRSRVGLRHYWRYRDDILCIFDEQSADIHKFISAFRLKAHVFKIVCDKISSETVNMLDVTISVHLNQGKFHLQYKPFFKPTSLHVPLSTTSAHNTSTLVSWPFNEIRRLALLSSTRHDFFQAKLTFVSRFIDAFEPMVLVDALLKYDPWHIFKETTPNCKSKKSTVSFWLAIPFHPFWLKSGLQRAINNFLATAYTKDVWRTCSGDADAPVISITWKNCNLHAHAIIAHIAKE